MSKKYIDEIESLKDEKCNLEILYQELEAAYDKDKLLWEGKF